MECNVCYESNAHCTLICKHVFCHGCIKKWCLTGTGQGCPMCRRAIYFKGFHKKQEEWAEEAWENKVSEVFGEAIDQLVEWTADMKTEFPKHSRMLDRDLQDDLKRVDKTVRFLKAENVCEEDIADCLSYEDYYSDRCLNTKNQGREKPRQMPHPKVSKRASVNKILNRRR